MSTSFPPPSAPDEPGPAERGRAAIDTGVAGASARREHERRKSNRQKRVREKHPRIGGAVLALTDDPRHERAWSDGALGEEQVAATLAKRLNSDAIVLHDRRIPGTRANIDHIAVAPSGVWVIDSKRYKGKVEVRKPLFGKAKLVIAGRDQTKLIDGLERQVGLVKATMAELAPSVPVHGVLCFTEADLPLMGSLSMRGFPLLYRKALAKRINKRGPFTAEQVRTLAAGLAEQFPVA